MPPARARPRAGPERAPGARIERQERPARCDEERAAGEDGRGAARVEAPRLAAGGHTARVRDGAIAAEAALPARRPRWRRLGSVQTAGWVKTPQPGESSVCTSPPRRPARPGAQIPPVEQRAQRGASLPPWTRSRGVLLLAIAPAGGPRGRAPEVHVSFVELLVVGGRIGVEQARASALSARTLSRTLSPVSKVRDPPRVGRSDKRPLPAGRW